MNFFQELSGSFTSEFNFSSRCGERATTSLIDLCNFSSPSNWTRWLLSGRLHCSLDKRIGPVRYLVSWWIWARCLIYWTRWLGQPSTRESPENFPWHTFDKVAEQGEATAIIRWEIFSNRPRMFKSIEKARKVFILLRFLSVFEQFHNFDNFRQGCKRGREFIFTLHICYFTSFFILIYFFLSPVYHHSLNIFVQSTCRDVSNGQSAKSAGKCLTLDCMWNWVEHFELLEHARHTYNRLRVDSYSYSLDFEKIWPWSCFELANCCWLN